MTEKIMKPGVWKTRDEKTVTVRHDATKRDCPWIGSDNKTRYPNGQWMRHDEGPHDLVEYLGEAPEPPTPQSVAAEELAALKDDRDKWQARAVQAEGRASNLAKDLIKADEQVDELQQQLTVATADRDTFRADANRARDQLEIARQQLQDRDAADQVPGNEQLRQQVTQLIAEREGLTQQLRQHEQQNVRLTKDLEGLRFELRHSKQQHSILLETSQDQLGQIRMAERVISIMADKVAQLAVEGA